MMEWLWTSMLEWLWHFPPYALMLAVGGTLIYLAIVKNYEPMLLLPMGVGTLLANVPGSGAIDQPDGHGVLSALYRIGIDKDLFPLLIFIGIGAMIDFKPLLQAPRMLLFGAAAQFGIFFTMCLAVLLGFSLKQSASIGIIGAADGPTSIVVANRFAPELLGAIMVAAYSYMSLVPIIQRPVIRWLTTPEERRIRMTFDDKPVSQTTRVLFPIMVTVLTGLLVPSAMGLIGLLMFGNLLRESLVVDRLSKAAQNELASVVTILLGLAIGHVMTADKFVTWQTLGILSMGVIAFVFDTAGGVIFAKLLNLGLKNKINPMIGACGISAFPMSARVVYKLGLEEDPQNHLLMPAISCNVSGQIGSVVAGGLLLALVAATPTAAPTTPDDAGAHAAVSATLPTAASDVQAATATAEASATTTAAPATTAAATQAQAAVPVLDTWVTSLLIGGQSLVMIFLIMGLFGLMITLLGRFSR